MSYYIDLLIFNVESFDLIVDAVAAVHDLNAYLALFKQDGTVTLVGAPATPHPSPKVFKCSISAPGTAS